MDAMVILVAHIERAIGTDANAIDELDLPWFSAAFAPGVD